MMRDDGARSGAHVCEDEVIDVVRGGALRGPEPVERIRQTCVRLADLLRHRRDQIGRSKCQIAISLSLSAMLRRNRAALAIASSRQQKRLFAPTNGLFALSKGLFALREGLFAPTNGSPFRKKGL
eukprot:1647680-Pleurochrysis_carterae.AAC.1